MLNFSRFIKQTVLSLSALSLLSASQPVRADMEQVLAGASYLGYGLALGLAGLAILKSGSDLVKATQATRGPARSMVAPLLTLIGSSALAIYIIKSQLMD